MGHVGGLQGAPIGSKGVFEFRTSRAGYVSCNVCESRGVYRFREKYLGFVYLYIVNGKFGRCK